MRRTSWTTGPLVLLVMALAASACVEGDPADPPEKVSDDLPAADDTDEPDVAGDPPPGVVSEAYSNLDHWLCHPDRADGPCGGDLSVTAVHADGTMEIVPHTPAADPAFDCFYVYPTTSLDETANSDRVAGIEEPFVVQNQAARLSSECRLYAPLYRQVTVKALLGGDTDADPELAYADVREAFLHFLTQVDSSRGFVLVGHSQGTSVLIKLLARLIETEPALEARLIAAYLIGLTVAVPDGADTGGSFDHIPLCKTPADTGCVVTYASFRSTAPPEDGALFGHVGDGEGKAGCTNPAALGGGPALLTPVFPIEIPGELAVLIGGKSSPWADPDTSPAITTPFFSLPDFVKAECVENGAYSYLEITVQADESDPRVDDITGDFAPAWGLHLVDMNLAIEAIRPLIRSQGVAWQAR